MELLGSVGICQSYQATLIIKRLKNAVPRRFFITILTKNKTNNNISINKCIVVGWEESTMEANSESRVYEQETMQHSDVEASVQDTVEPVRKMSQMRQLVMDYRCV